MSEAKNLEALLLGTGEFKFAEGATAATAGTPAKPYKSLGNVKAFSMQPENTKVEHKGSYRGIKRVDRTKVTEVKAGYVLTLDEFADLNLLMLFYGAAAAGFTQAAASSANGDAMDFSANAAVIGAWYDLKIAGARVRNLTAVTISTLTEGTDFVLDKELGRIRFLTAQSTSRTPVITAPAITISSAEYLKGITPLQSATKSGIGSLAIFDENTPKVVLEHHSFGCDLSLEGQPNIDGENYSEMQIKVQITDPVGTVHHRE
jgi:hypothetical protein